MHYSTYVLGFWGAVLPASAVAAVGESQPKVDFKGERPNVIFIYADDLGKGMISAYGQRIIKTPNIDKLVNQGIDFSNAYGCHYSAPARASLLTGYSDCHLGHWIKSRGEIHASHA